MMDEFTLIRHAKRLAIVADVLAGKARVVQVRPETWEADMMAATARAMHEALAAYFSDVAPVPVDPADERAARAMGEATE